jgi:hypothetical protein
MKVNETTREVCIESRHGSDGAADHTRNMPRCEASRENFLISVCIPLELMIVELEYGGTGKLLTKAD